MSRPIISVIRQRLWLAATGAVGLLGAMLVPQAALGRDTVGLVGHSVASLRSAPSHAAELETQALCGTPLVVGDSDSTGTWRQVTTPDGYRAWMHRTAIVPLDSASYDQWRRSERVVVSAPSRQWVMPDTLCCDETAEPICDLLPGALVQGRPGQGAYTAITLPDGRSGYLPSSAVTPAEEWASGGIDAARMLAVARSLMGTPYLWGGTTVHGTDCSGLVRVAAWECGVLLPRNASAQALCGIPVECVADSLQPGDLVFFAATPSGERITHVGIYEGEGMIIHSSGTVHRSHLFTDTLEALPGRMRWARRLSPGTPGVRRVADLPQYFLPVQPDTASSSSPMAGDNPDRKFRPTSLIAPALMVGVGAWGAAGGWPARADRSIHTHLGTRRTGAVSGILQAVPDLMMVLPSGWLPGERYNWRERVMLTVTGELISEAVVQTVKHTVSRRRPDGSDTHSFPSGHTARAFVGAELLRITYGGWVAGAGYAAAVLTGALRVAGGYHWFTDVLAGAGIGMLGAQAARLLLPLERRLLTRSGGVTLAAVPTYDPVSRAPGLALSLAI